MKLWLKGKPVWDIKENTNTGAYWGDETSYKPKATDRPETSKYLRLPVSTRYQNVSNEQHWSSTFSQVIIAMQKMLKKVYLKLYANVSLSNKFFQTTKVFRHLPNEDDCYSTLWALTKCENVFSNSFLLFKELLTVNWLLVHFTFWNSTKNWPHTPQINLEDPLFQTIRVNTFETWNTEPMLHLLMNGFNVQYVYVAFIVR